jgi:hypothetical protein
MGSGAMIYTPSFVKIGSGIQELLREGDSQTHRQHGDRMDLLLFLQKKMLKMIENAVLQGKLHRFLFAEQTVRPSQSV